MSISGLMDIIGSRPDAAPSIANAPEFVPIGVFTRAADDGPGLQARAGSVPITATTEAGRATVGRPAMDERPGVIEIDLVDGTRLRSTPSEYARPLLDQLRTFLDASLTRI